MPYNVKDTLLARKTLVLAKSETAYGVDPTPSQTTDVMLAVDVDISKPRTFIDRETEVGPSLSRLQGIVGERHGEISFGTEIIGSLIGTQPEIEPLLLACGFKRTQGDPSYSYVYKPWSKSWGANEPKSCTLYVYFIEAEGDEAILEKFTGCVGNLAIVSTQSQILRFNWTLRGIYNAASKVNVGFDNPTIPSQLPLKVQDITLQLGGVQVDTPVEAFEIDMQNELSPSKDVQSDYGVIHWYITNRNPVGSLNPELSNSSTSLAPTLIESDIDTPTTQTLTANYVRGTRGLQITAPKLVKKNAAWGIREGVRVYDIPFQLARNSGDDELQLAFAPV